MVTTEIFEKLKDLQGILGKKYELEAKIADAPKQLTTQEELLSKLKKEFIEKSNEYESVKDTVNALSLDLDAVVKTLEAGEKNMDNITTHREYEALDKQISEASLKEAEIRKELQKEERKLEQLKDIIDLKKDLIDSQEKDLNETRSKLDSEIAGYKAELDSLVESENSITPDLDQEILFKFQRIIQRNSEGIVAVRNGVCTGCHMILPAQFANEVHEGENILFCPYCSRILYHEDAAEDSQETFFNDAGSLADLSDDDFDSDSEYDDEDEREELDEDSEDIDSLDESEEDEDEELEDSEDSEE